MTKCHQVVITTHMFCLFAATLSFTPAFRPAFMAVEQSGLPATLGALLSGHAVDGEIRVMPARPEPDESWRVVGHTALTDSEFKESVLERAAPPPQLSLLGNNCWSFATSVLQSNCLEKPS